MTAENQDMDELIKRVTAGEPIDWDKEHSRFPNESDFLTQLKSIQKINQVLSTAENQNESNIQTEEAYDFMWGHLKVKHKIGEGSFGEVFKAFDTLLDRDVALKLLKSEQLGSTYKARNFITEARSLAKVRNRHVLAIHGASIHEGRVGFWSDLLDGSTLVNESGYDEDAILDLTHALADALEAVHGANLIHGDVKTSNVMRDSAGHYSLMDFGAGGEIDLTSSAIGSPITMAPELFDEKVKSPASDVYALGCMLFKLATGEYPIKAKNLMAVMNAHRDNKYLSLDQLRPDLNTHVRRMINHMLAVDPSERPGASELKTTVSSIRAIPEKRNKRMVLWGIFSILVLATVISSWGFYQANKAKKVAEVEQQKSAAVSEFLQEMLESPSEFGEGQQLKVIKLLEYSAKNAKQNLIDHPTVLATIEHALGRAYNALYLYEKASVHLDSSILLNSELYGEDHQLTLESVLAKALSLNGMGQFEESIVATESVLKLTPVNSQYEKENIQKANFLLSFNYTRMNNPEKALQYLEGKDIEIRTPDEALSRNSNHILQMKSSAYMSLGDHQKAERYAREALDWYQAWGATERNKHRNINFVPTRTRLGNVLQRQGKLAEAEIHLTAALEEAELFYGPDSRGYLGALNNLSLLVYSQGKYHEALDYQQRAMDLSMVLFGSIHEYTVIIGTNLANTQISLGDLVVGEKTMRESLASAISLGGEESYNAMRLEYNLADLMMIQGKYTEAEQLGQINYQRMLKVLGEDDDFTMRALSNLAAILSNQKRYTEAEVLHDDAVTQLGAKMGHKHAYYFDASWNRIIHYQQSNQKILGLKNLRELIENQTEILGAEHAETVRSQELLNQWQ